MLSHQGTFNDFIISEIWDLNGIFKAYLKKLFWETFIDLKIKLN